MLHKLKQGTLKHQFTSSNRLPARRASKFLLNNLRELRGQQTSAALRAAMGLIR